MIAKYYIFLDKAKRRLEKSMSHRTGISGGQKRVISTYSPGRVKMNRHKYTLLGPYFANGAFSKDDSFQPVQD